jgi:DNA-binding MarR family transcriptional regulator
MKHEELLYLENQLCFPLYAASRLTTQMYGPLLHELDITYPQYLVLLVLWQRGALSVTEIGGLLLLDTNTLTPLLKRMEEKGLLVRLRSKEDARSVLVSLSPAGQQLKEKALCVPMQVIANFQAGGTLTHEEVVAFKATLHKIVGALAAE